MIDKIKEFAHDQFVNEKYGALGIRCGFSLPLNHKFIPKNRNSVVQYI